MYACACGRCVWVCVEQRGIGSRDVCFVLDVVVTVVLGWLYECRRVKLGSVEDCEG